MTQIYRIPSRLDTLNAADVEKEIFPLSEASNFLILDFSSCNYISSMGIRVILGAKKRMSAKNGELFLCGLCSPVYGVFEMSGMTSFLKICKDVDSAENAISALSGKSLHNLSFQSSGKSFDYVEEAGYVKMTLWGEEDDNYKTLLAGYDELAFSIGFGTPADEIFYYKETFLPFIATGRFAAFIDAPDDSRSDFRTTIDPSRAGIYLDSAISFGDLPSGSFKCNSQNGATIEEWALSAVSLQKEQYREAQKRFLLIILDGAGNSPSLHLIMVANKQIEITKSASIFLSQWRTPRNDYPLATILKENLTIENILQVSTINPSEVISGATAYPFYAKESISSLGTRLAIESANPDSSIELYKEFLARRIYTDSSKIVIKRLTGGYSAQTFQVSSFDSDGRKLRSTVMKVADKNMIERESSRCTTYAQPYILNNSAQVLGTEFFSDMGALRYNFVGIGGGDSELKWLTNYYLEDSFLELEPLFDKIFLTILDPWYGQAVNKSIYPFLDHDPTLTFFSSIFQTAKDVLGIDSDNHTIFIDELGREALNPYWYLRNIYPTRRDYHFPYYVGVCHGDLNMQNILIDENKNVYLIDFSETKFRAAISDFARLEAIMLVDNAPEGLGRIDSLKRLYGEMRALDTPIDAGDDKDLLLTRKMRQYALKCVHGDTNPLPYYFALLEWILPIVCYGNKPLSTKRLSMVISSLLMEKIEQALNNQ